MLRRRVTCRLIAGCCAMAALLAGASCSHPVPHAMGLEQAKMATVAIGRSSRNDVFAALGSPARTTQSLAGETWVYETSVRGGGDGGVKAGAVAVAGVAGAFVPFVGLIGPGIGLATLATGQDQPPPGGASLTVSFGEDGVVRDCVYASTAVPAGLGGPAPVMGCQRPRTMSENPDGARVAPLSPVSWLNGRGSAAGTSSDL